MKKGTKQPTIKVSHIAETIAREAVRNSFNFVFKHTGESFFEKDGEVISVSDFEKMYPVIKLQPVSFKGANPDLKKNFVNGIKSY